MPPRTRSSRVGAAQPGSPSSNTTGAVVETPTALARNTAEPEPTSAIRPYELRDAKELQILMGMRVFEQLPVANKMG